MQEQEEIAKLDIKDLLPIGLVMVVTGIVLSFGAQVQSEIDDDFTPDSWEANISAKSLEGQYNLTKKMPTIGTVAAIVIVIGLLLSGFAYMMGNRWLEIF